MEITIVIPCYNESKGLASLVERCSLVVSKAPVKFILVDNGSTDETPSLLPSLVKNRDGLQSLRIEKNQGYGFGILSGLKLCNTEYIGWTHADLQTDPADVLKAYEIINQLKSDKLYIKGRRFGRPLADIFFTICMSIFETIMLRKTFWDINAQPNIFPKSFYDSWKGAPSDFSLDLFAYYQGKKFGLKFKRIPVHFGPRQFGQSHWNTGWKMRMKFIKRTLDLTWKLKNEVLSE